MPPRYGLQSPLDLGAELPKRKVLTIAWWSLGAALGSFVCQAVALRDPLLRRLQRLDGLQRPVRLHVARQLLQLLCALAHAHVVELLPDTTPQVGMRARRLRRSPPALLEPVHDGLVVGPNREGASPCTITNRNAYILIV